MNNKMCKYCGKEVNKKAEICPYCGCRIKSNILKIVLVNIGIIVVIIVGILLFQGTRKVLKK